LITIAVTAGMLFAASSAQAFTASLQAPTHHPQAGKHWPIKVGAHQHGKAIHASAFYQFLFSGNVVQSCTPIPNKPGGKKCNDGKSAKPWHFNGSFRDVVVWPKRAIGYPLTFRVVIHARHGGTKHVDYPVRVHG
jgi:hypothetical protein